MAERQLCRRGMEVEPQQQWQCRRRFNISCRLRKESDRADDSKQTDTPTRGKRKETTDVVYGCGRDVTGNRPAKALEQEGD